MRGLVIPTSLVVTALQLGCPRDSDPDPTTTTTTDPTTTTTTASTSTSEMTTSSTSSSSGTSSDTGDATTSTSSDTTTSDTSSSSADSSGSSETGEPLPDCNAIEEPKACNAMPGCLYDVVVGQCDVDCTLIEDMAVCVDQTGVCYWLDGACHHVAI